MVLKFEFDGKMYGVRFFRREFVEVPTSRGVVYVDNGTFSEIVKPEDVGLEEADLIRLFKIGRGYGLIHGMEGGFEHTRAKAELAICKKEESGSDYPSVKGWTVFRWE